MKPLFVCVLLLVGLTACVGPSAPGGGRCSKQGEVCIQVKAIEPIRFGEPVTLTITVTARKDLSTLGVSLYHDVDTIVEAPQGQEKEAQNTVVSRSGIDWIVNAKANQSISFTRKMRFPPREGVFTLVVSASTPSFRVEDSVVIHLTRAGGKVYLSGTSIPITPGPAPTITPGPSPTFIPTPARFVSPLATPIRALSPLATPTPATTP